MIYYHRWKNEPDQPITTYVLRHHKTRNGGKELPYKPTQEQVLKDMETVGVPADKSLPNGGVINEFQTYYFPHVYSEDYAAGWYDKVEAMQGKNNTYYAGEIMSFGDMDETVEYSHDLVERFFND